MKKNNSKLLMYKTILVITGSNVFGERTDLTNIKLTTKSILRR